MSLIRKLGIVRGAAIASFLVFLGLYSQIQGQGRFDITKFNLKADSSQAVDSLVQTDVVDSTESKANSQPMGDTLKPMSDGEINYGYLSMTIFPGFKSIRLDRETTVGLSDMILIPAGGHWVEITGPEGYADTSFKVLIKTSEVLNKEVQLRNLVTGEFATGPAAPEQPPLNWKKIGKITAFSLSALSFVLALNEERLARDANEAYDRHKVDGASDYDKLYNELEDHIKKRNAMGLLSVLSLGVGIVLWRF